MRVGYAVSHPEVADVLNRVRPAFNVNSVAQAGALAGARRIPHTPSARWRRRWRSCRAWRGACEALGLTVVPSAGNFLLVHVGRAQRPSISVCCAGGVIVRPVAGYGLPQCLRITIGTPRAERAACLRCWPRCLEGVR